MASIKLVQLVLGPIMTNCYILINTDSSEAVVIDPADNAKEIEKVLETEKSVLKTVLLTHGHFDHMSAVNDLKEYAPEAEVVIGINDKKYLEDPNLNLSASFVGKRVTAKADKLVVDGEDIEVIGLKCKCLEVPGHTPGGMCYYFPELISVFDGDTLFYMSCGRSDFPGGDAEALNNGIKDKLFTLPEETIVYPGHETKTTIKKEKEFNPWF